MFSSLLRRPPNGPRRVDICDGSPSPRRPFTARAHATADFTEADDDDDNNDVDDDGHNSEAGRERPLLRRRVFHQPPSRGPVDDADEDGAIKPLPVLPLFSVTYLGTSTRPPGPPLFRGAF